MHNIWFAVEDRSWANSLKKNITGSEITATWFPATGDGPRPFPNLLDAIQRSKVDMLFYQSYHQPFPTLSLLRQVPTIILLDGAPLRSFIREPRRSSGHAFMAFLRTLKGDERLAHGARQAAGFVVWSEWAKQELIAGFGVESQRVLVARTGVDLSEWDADLEDFQITRRPARTLPERIRLLFAGDDFESLGGNLLLKAYEADPALADLTELHVITRRATAAAYLEKAPSTLPVYLHSFDAPAELYLNSDIYVLPAISATSPSQLATALAAGLPIVTTPVGGLAELVQDGQNGLLVPPGDPAALAQALHHLVDDPAWRYQLGQHSRQLAENEFQSSATAKALLAFANSVNALQRPAAIPAKKVLSALVTR